LLFAPLHFLISPLLRYSQKLYDIHKNCMIQVYDNMFDKCIHCEIFTMTKLINVCVTS
jgi:hypothetical protein